MTHLLKIWKKYADLIVAGKKTFEIRKDDRGFEEGDLINFVIFDGETKTCSCDHPICQKTFEITYIFRGGKYGLERGYVIFGIREVKIKSVEEVKKSGNL